MGIRIIVVDDHEIIRLGLRSSLKNVHGIDVIGEANSGEEALMQAGSLKPDIVIMDVNMPEMNGIEACAAIKTAYPNTKVIILTAYADERTHQEAKMAGASDYVLKSISMSQLIEVIKKVAFGDSRFFGGTFEDGLEQVNEMETIEDNEIRDLIEELTDREKRILELVALGYTNRDIATQLFLSEKTVRNYVSNILGKLQVANRTQAAAYTLKRKYSGGA